MRFILRWIISAATLLLITRLIPGVVVSGWVAALVAALFLGLANAVIRPIIILLTLPLTIITLGLFTLVVNAFMFWLVASVVDGFTVVNFTAAFWGALVLSGVSLLTSWLLKKE